MDDLDIAAVAARLGKSVRWLQEQLAEDWRQPQPVLQHHHRIGRNGRTRLWTEGEFVKLRAALIELGREKERRAREKSGRPDSRSSNSTATGGSMGQLLFEDPRAACDAVLAYRPGQNSKSTRSKSSATSKTASSTKSSTASNRRSRLGLRLVNTSD
jgi:hypothetical protein